MKEVDPTRAYGEFFWSHACVFANKTLSIYVRLY